MFPCKSLYSNIAGDMNVLRAKLNARSLTGQ